MSLDVGILHPAAVGTQRWLERAVIGLNLCPFAKAVHVRGQIRYAVSDAESTETLRDDFTEELEHIRTSDPALHDTTLVIAPRVLSDFLQFNDFLAEADAALRGLRMQRDFQIASFHPHYQFAGEAPDDIANYTNRAPFPTLHVLREASVDRAVAAFPDASEIFARNIDVLRRLGVDGWHRTMNGTPGALSATPHGAHP